MDLDQTDDVWSVELTHHKNSARGKERVVLVGPGAQRVLRPFLADRPVDRPLFRPVEALKETAKRKRRGRRTPLWPSHRRRYARERAARCRRKVGEVYTSQAVTRAIARAVRAENKRREQAARKSGAKEWARLESWTAYRIRHAAASRIRVEKGEEGVRAVLGHSSSSMSRRYGSASMEKARRVMKEVG
jgi:hypothetical protein